MALESPSDRIGLPAAIAAPARPAAARPALAATQRLHLSEWPWVERLARSALNPLLDLTRLEAACPDAGLVVLCVGFGQGPLGLDALDVLPARFAGSLRLHGLSGEPAALSHRQREYPDHAGLLAALQTQRSCRRSWGRVALHRGDPRRTLMRLAGQARLVLLEPDRPEAAPTLYSLDFLLRLTHRLAPGGVLLSASTAPALCGALLRLGLAVSRTAAGTAAAWQAELLCQPMSTRERRRLQGSCQSLPYRDRTLTWTGQHILRHRERLGERLQRRGLGLATTPATGEPRP
ncbi:MAG: hypothetical protein GX595_19310 [Lentisphaerae bacterium]|nr:hypothetical protein [Lentisphaerota bacterium]